MGGNPLSYYNGNSYTFTWAQGRRLATAVKGSNTLSFEYNDEGIRTSKTVNGITHHYQLAGSRILSENWIDSSGVYHVVVFIYDENGSPIGMSYSNSNYSDGVADNYLFVKNMQGDIVHICDESGNKVVSYEYDAWGVTTSYSGYNTTAYKINPFRYRGYFYDAETGLYYLNSRYYDPAIGRFINADGYVSTGTGLLGYNMFAYCNNNPIVYVDYSGKLLKKLLQSWVVNGGAVAAAEPSPFGELVWIAGTVLIGGTIILVNAGKQNPIKTPQIHIKGKVKHNTTEKDSIIEQEKDAISKLSSDTIIYRYGGTNPGNLTPRPKDMYSGLSFSIIPLPGAAMTTIGELNATGIVYAVQDGPTHVSVRPVGATVRDWILAGSSSIWTTAVKSCVNKWYGGVY